MSEDKPSPTSPLIIGAAEPPAPTPAIIPQSNIGIDTGARAPEAIVRGGTLSSSAEQQIKEFEKDAEERRDIHEKEKAIARKPVEQGGGMMFSQNYADSSSPQTPITYMGHNKNEPFVDMLCDVLTELHSDERTLIFVCPECVKRGVPSGQAQCAVKSSHRKWFIDTRGAGSLRQMESPTGPVPYVYAGLVMDTEKLTCSNLNCGASYKIHKGVMYRV